MTYRFLPLLMLTVIAIAAAETPTADTNTNTNTNANANTDTDTDTDTSANTAITTIGTLKARQTSILGAQVSGRVAAVLVEVGDRVEKGQELIQVDPVFFKLTVESRQADLISAKARLITLGAMLTAAMAQIDASEAEVADAELNLTRMRALWEKPAGAEPSIPKRLYDEAATRARLTAAKLTASRAAVEEVTARTSEAQSAIASAEVGLRQAQQNLAESTVRAPYAGAITKRLVDAGGSVTNAPATDLMEIQETARLYLECSLPQEQLPAIAIGTPLTFTIDGVAGTHQATISAIFPALDAATRSLRFRADIDNADGKLRPGLLAAVKVGL